MIFRLYESVPNLPDYVEQEFDDASKQEQVEIIKDLIENDYKKPDLYNILDAIYMSCVRSGLDTKSNKFLQLIDKLNFKIDKEHAKNFYNLVKLSTSSTIDLTRPYLTKPAIYEVDEKDFDYTVKLFDIVNNKSKISKFFNNVDNISEKDLYDEQGNIKPVGKEGSGTDTLFGTVESWSQEGANDKSKGSEFVVTASQLNKAKKNPIRNLEEVPKELCREGTLIYVNFLRHRSDRVNFEDEINDFMIYHDGKWVRLPKSK